MALAAAAQEALFHLHYGSREDMAGDFLNYVIFSLKCNNSYFEWWGDEGGDDDEESNSLPVAPFSPLTLATKKTKQGCC